MGFEPTPRQAGLRPQRSVSTPSPRSQNEPYLTSLFRIVLSVGNSSGLTQKGTRVCTLHPAGSDQDKAEEGGFEPPVEFPLQRLSRASASTTRPPLRTLYGGGGRSRTYDVSYVTVLQTAAFAARHTPPY